MLFHMRVFAADTSSRHNVVDPTSDDMCYRPSIQTEHPVALLVTGKEAFFMGIGNALRGGTAAFYRK